MVRERSAKPLCAGSIPARASKLPNKIYGYFDIAAFLRLCLFRSQSWSIGENEADSVSLADKNLARRRVKKWTRISRRGRSKMNTRTRRKLSRTLLRRVFWASLCLPGRQCVFCGFNHVPRPTAGPLNGIRDGFLPLCLGPGGRHFRLGAHVKHRSPILSLNSVYCLRLCLRTECREQRFSTSKVACG